MLPEAADARAEPPPQHRERGEVDLRVAVGVGVVLLQLQVALVVEEPVEHERRVPVGAFDRHAVERRVVVGDEGIELQGEVAEPGAVGLLQDLAGHGEPLPVAGRRPAFAPVERGVEAGDGVHQRRQGGALRLLGHLPVADPLENFPINEFFEVQISSRKKPHQRGIDGMLERLAPGDRLIVSELSRLGRSLGHANSHSRRPGGLDGNSQSGLRRDEKCERTKAQSLPGFFGAVDGQRWFVLPRRLSIGGGDQVASREQ